MLKEFIKKSMKGWVNNEDSFDGCIDLTDDDLMYIANIIVELSDKNKYMSKYQACKYLNISRAKFDNLVREGKLPKGVKKAGFTELFYNRIELDKAIKKLN